MPDWSWKGGKVGAPNDITDRDNYIDLATDATPTASAMPTSTVVYVGNDMIAAMGGGTFSSSSITLVIQPEARFPVGTAASPVVCPTSFTSVTHAGPVNAYLSGSAPTLKVQGIGNAQCVFSAGTLGQTAFEVSQGKLVVGANCELHSSHTLFVGPDGVAEIERGATNPLRIEVDRGGFAQVYQNIDDAQVDGTLVLLGATAQASGKKAVIRSGGLLSDASSGQKRTIDVRPGGAYVMSGSGAAPTIDTLIETPGARIVTRVGGKAATVTARQYRYESGATSNIPGEGSPPPL